MFIQVKNIEEAIEDLLEMEVDDRERFLMTCKLEACSGHNDGWVMGHYQTYLDAAKHLEDAK